MTSSFFSTYNSRLAMILSEILHRIQVSAIGWKDEQRWQFLPDFRIGITMAIHQNKWKTVFLPYFVVDEK